MFSLGRIAASVALVDAVIRRHAPKRRRDWHARRVLLTARLCALAQRGPSVRATLSCA
jgi:hypothetical protein